MHKYAVALSFAGDERHFAKAVAEGLRAADVTVFYDEYEQHALWGNDLYETLQRVYVKDCRYCVLLLTKAYLQKMWPIFERRQIIDRLAKEHGSECVLPVRLNGFPEAVPGLSGGIGYLAVDDDRPDIVVDALLKKLSAPGYEIDSESAYAQAVNRLHQRGDGYVDVHRIFTSREAVSHAFGQFIDVQLLLGAMGHRFYWRRQSGDALELLARNDGLPELKGKGLTGICKFLAPEAWIGCGTWQLVIPEYCDTAQIGEDDEIVIALYLNSEEWQVLGNGQGFPCESVFLAGVCLKGPNAEAFFRLARERFSSIA